MTHGTLWILSLPRKPLLPSPRELIISDTSHGSSAHQAADDGRRKEGRKGGLRFVLLALFPALNACRRTAVLGSLREGETREIIASRNRTLSSKSMEFNSSSILNYMSQRKSRVNVYEQAKLNRLVTCKPRRGKPLKSPSKKTTVRRRFRRRFPAELTKFSATEEENRED